MRLLAVSRVEVRVRWLGAEVEVEMARGVVVGEDEMKVEKRFWGR